MNADVRLHDRPFVTAVSALRFLGRLQGMRRVALTINLCGALSGALQLIIPLATAHLINRAIPGKHAGEVVLIVTVLGTAALINIALSLWETRLSCAFRERSLVVAQSALFRHIQRCRYAFFLEHESGYVMSRILGDTTSAVDLAMMVVTLGRTAVVICGSCVLLPYFDWSLGLMALLVVPAHCVILVCFQRRTRDMFVEVSERTAITSRELFESLTGIVVTKAFGIEKRRLCRFFRDASQRARVQVRARMLMAFGGQATSIVTLVVSLGILIIGAFKIIDGRLSIGNLVGINAAAVSLLGVAASLTQTLLNIQGAVAAVRRIEDWMELPAEQQSRSEHLVLAGSIRFEHVRFAYGNGPVVLRDVSLTVSPGEVVLVCGASGAGKSTLLKLLTRFLEPSLGTIWLDGRNINTLSLLDIRRQIGYISQDTFLFSDTVMQNITLGNRFLCEADVIEVCRTAGALNCIRDLPQGFDTRVGERGVRLSGGQRQRIALARALVSRVPILILDEATSAIDQETEAAVHDALLKLAGVRTVIVVAHHASAFIHHVNSCYALEQGRLRRIEIPTNGDVPADSMVAIPKQEDCRCNFK